VAAAAIAIKETPTMKILFMTRPQPVQRALHCAHVTPVFRHGDNPDSVIENRRMYLREFI
jgi:hypothetical protein